MKIYIDGKYYNKIEAKISVYDHGLLYGDGVFEGIRIYNNKIFKIEEHLSRLYQSAQSILLHIPLDKNTLKQTLIDAVKENRKKDGYIRLIVSRGTGDLGIDPDKCTQASIIIIVDDIDVYSAEYYEKGINIITASTRRISFDCIDPKIKSLNYLNNILAKIEAKRAGCLEAVMLNKQGFVAECTSDNIFLVKQNQLFTPDIKCGILEGITRETVLELAEKLNLVCHSGYFTCHDLYNADECFLTGSAVEIMPVISIDGHTIGKGVPGSVTKQMVKCFKEYVVKG